jgi:hypothetical protein
MVSAPNSKRAISDVSVCLLASAGWGLYHHERPFAIVRAYPLSCVTATSPFGSAIGLRRLSTTAMSQERAERRACQRSRSEFLLRCRPADGRDLIRCVRVLRFCLTGLRGHTGTERSRLQRSRSPLSGNQR